MKARTMFRIFIAAGLLLGLLAAGQYFSRNGPAAQGSALAQSIEPPAQYTLPPGSSGGGGYRLATLAQQAETVSSCGKYRLALPSNPASGVSCCCSYLPWLKK